MSQFVDFFDEEKISKECTEKLEMLDIMLPMLGYTMSCFYNTIYFYLEGSISFSIFKENTLLTKTDVESYKFEKKNLYNVQIVPSPIRKKVKNLSTKDLDINKTTNLLLLMI